MFGLLNYWDETTQQYVEFPVLKGSSISPLDFYPIGSYYISSNSTSPALLFGGDWDRIENVFLLGASADQAAGSYIAGDTGGEATHTLIVDEIPSHKHSYYPRVAASAGSVKYGYWYAMSSTVYDTTPYTYEAGGGQPHNNMPPYKVVYMWERVA